MHSSRMRTGRSLTVSAWSGGGCLPDPGGCLPGPLGGSAWSGGGVCLVPGGCLPGPGGSAWSRGGGVCLVPGGGGLAGDPPTPVDRITDTCKNITLACGR